MIVHFLSIALLSAAQPAEVPAEEAAAETAAETAKTANGDLRVTSDGKEDLAIDKQNAGKMICKRFTDTGSRISSRKVCKTEAEWEDQRLDNADLMRTKRGAAGGPQPNSG